MAYFFAEKVSYNNSLVTTYCTKFFCLIQNHHFGLFIVLPLHKESLRNMVEKSLANYDVKVSVLKMLKPIVIGKWDSHGDIKDGFY